MSFIDDVASIKGKILVIDDDDDVREIFKMQLESNSFKVMEARNGEEAIALMQLGSNLLQVGLIICDIRMPKVNGIEAIEYLKKNAPSIPIVVITGYPDAKLAVSLLKRGVKDYLVKPVEKEKLLEKVREILSSEQEFDYV